jgi:hypothetical protein
VSFVAKFEGGPEYGPRQRTFMAPSVPQRLFFAPERRLVDRRTITHDGWMLVGASPGAEPAEPWPGQLEFVLDTERSRINLGAPGEDWGTAVYVFNDQA